MCPIQNCKNCREYASCPLLSATVQRSYTNRVLVDILKALEKIDKKLENSSKK